MIVQHHEKYEEIHGYDEIRLMSQSEHKKLHERLRRDRKCTIDPKTLKKISTKAHYRTESYKLKHKNHRFRFLDKLYPDVNHVEEIVYNPISGNVKVFCFFRGKRIRSEQTKNTDKKYISKNIFKKNFHKSLGNSIDLWGFLNYNKKTNHLRYYSGFYCKKNKLPEVLL